MGWYIRKSKSFGPFRLNFSKSGLGLSTGIKGARISVGPSGTYISGGKNGLYYRQKIGGNSKSAQRRARVNNIMNDKEVSKDFIAESSIEELSKDVNKTHRLYNIWKICFIISIIVAIVYENIYILLISLLLIILFIIFKNKMVFNIDYDLEGESNDRWQAFLQEMKSIFSSKKIWIISTSSLNYWKTNAGTNRGVKRKNVTSARIIKKGKNNKARIKFNNDIYQIIANKYSVIFAPSMIVIVKGRKVNCYTYKDLDVYIGSCYFVEDSKHSVPRDATIIDYRWQYINKDGTRDLRYRTNKQLPRCEYGMLELKSSIGQSIEFEFSNKDKVEAAKFNIRDYINYVKYLPILDNKEVNNLSFNIESKDSADNKIEFSEETKELINKQNNPLLQDLYDNMELDNKDE